MKFISYRGNIDGPRPVWENNPQYVDIALQYGYYVFLDVWYEEGQFYLGSNVKQYPIFESFLEKDKYICYPRTWETFDKLLRNEHIHTLWHDIDYYTITNRGWVWAHEHAENYSENTIITNFGDMDDIPNVAGICSNYIRSIRRKATYQDQKPLDWNDAREINDVVPDWVLRNMEKYDKC